MHAHEMPRSVCDVPRTRNRLALEIAPLIHSGLGACLGSAALAQVVFSVSSRAVFLSSFSRFDVLV
jgi:hypothetical protein